MTHSAIRMFCSYSHKDEELRNSLEAHLSILKRQGVAIIWHDRKIIAGQTWASEIDEQLKDADVVLLLISADFIASDYCYGKELEHALEKHREGKALVVPIILRPADWSEAPFAKFQALPKDAMPVTTWKNEDEAWLDVAKGIRRMIAAINFNKLPTTASVTQINDLTRSTQRRFVHTKISSKGLLELEHYTNPYSEFRDPTDSYDISPTSTVYAFAWLPTSMYLKSSQLQQLTPVAAICTVEPKLVLNAFRSNLDASLMSQFEKPPSKLRNEEKEIIITAMAKSLSECFLLGVSIPSLVLGIGKNKPKLAYQAITNIFLVPLLQMHKNQGFEQFHIKLSRVGDESAALLSFTKTVLKASYPQKNSSSADFIDEKEDQIVFERMARFLAWAVGAFYNSGNPRWVEMLDQVIHKKEPHTFHLKEYGSR